MRCQQWVAACFVLCVASAAGSLVREKRQATFTFSQPYYQFCLTALVPNTFVGQLATNSQPVTWSRTPGSVNSNFALDNTGRLILSNYVQAGSPTQNVLISAANSAGTVITTSVLVASSCAGSATVAPSAGQPIFALGAYTFPSTCTLGNNVGSVSATTTSGSISYSLTSGTAFFYIAPTTGAISLAGYPTSTSTPFTVRATNTQTGLSTTVPVTVTTSAICMPPTAAPQAVRFGQSSYTMTAASCSNGGLVDIVLATSSTGAAVTYSISGTQFSILPTNGIIKVATALTASTTPIMVTITATEGSNTATASAAITPTCTTAAPVLVTGAACNPPTLPTVPCGA